MRLWELEAHQEGPCLQDKLRSLDSTLSIMCMWKRMGKGHNQIWILGTVIFDHSGVSEVNRWKAGRQVRKVINFQEREDNLFIVAIAGLSMILVVNSIQ